MKWWIWFLIIGGIVFLISISLVIYSVVKLVGPISLSLDYPSEEAKNNPRCSAINLEIVSINAETKKMVVKRNLGGEDFSKIKIYYNGIKAISNVGANNLKEGTSIEVSAGYKVATYGNRLNVGDELFIAPILNDGTLCDLKDSAIAVV